MAAPPAAPPPADQVASFELFKVPPRWVFLRVETKRGIIGWGEPNVEGFSDTVMAAVQEIMTRMVVGADPQRIQFLWQKIYRQSFYFSGPILMSALAGIDQALWDIQGKTLGCPVHRLLGGAVRDKLKVYRWCGGDNNTPAEAAAEAKRAIDESRYKQLKMNACPKMEYVDTERAVQAAADRMRAVRAAVGPDVGIGLDFHGRVKVPMAKKLMRALEPYDPLFFEEPVSAAQNKSLTDLAAFTAVPLATGERMFRTEEFRDLLEQRAVGIVQPDCSHVGGISNMLTIARLAECYDVGFAPHCPLGPIALASCMQVDACALNFVFQETSQSIHYNQERTSSKGGAGVKKEEEGHDLLDYLTPASRKDFDVDDEGFIALLTRPGIGIEMDEDKVRRMAKIGHDWRDREWHLRDGAPTTW